MKKLFNNRQNKGITLIALVITIIVLLILAGVSIAMLTGQNGILTQAQNSKQATEKSEVKEKAQTDIAGVQTAMQSTEISRIVLKGILDKYFENVPDDIKSDTELTTKAEYGNIKMKVSDIYSGEIVDRYMAADIANATQEDKQNLYGATVTGYTLPSETTTDVGWKIFYADNSNIYLIADNYVERNNLPNSTTESGVDTANKPNDGNYARSAYFFNILGNYVGSSRITDSRLKALNSDYFNTKNYSSTNGNMKAVAYMMDTTAWNSKFLDSSKAEYAIGGPTIELLFKSYNEKYGTSYVAGATNSMGYSIKKQESDSWSTYINGMLTKNDYIQDSLYVISKDTNAAGMWLASSSANSENEVMDVRFNGHVLKDWYDNQTFGFRPLVCLKSNTQLQKVEDTTYQIK